MFFLALLPTRFLQYRFSREPPFTFFFDEAHLLFGDAPPALLEKVEQVVRLIRSKGVGVYFVTQNPLDIPDAVLGQLGNRVQHALRAFTPRDQKAVKAAADTLRANPAFDAAMAITELGVGEALVSFLDEHGRPTVVERAMVLPPASRIGPMSAEERRAAIAASPIAGFYEKALDRESAYEKLRGDANQKVGAGDTATQAPAEPAASGGGLFGGIGDALGGMLGGGGGARSTGARGRQTVVEAAVTSTVRAIGSSLGREIVRGVLGSIMGGRRR